MRKVLEFAMRYLLATLAIPLLLVGCDSPTSSGMMPIRGTLVTLTTDGRAKADPDLAEVTGGVVSKAPTAKEALAKQAVKMNAISASLAEVGIAAKDVVTAQVNITPNYDWTPKNGQRITGYEATNVVTIKVRDTSKVGTVLDKMVSDGSNRIDSVVFKLENQDGPQQAARKDALTKAQARAAAYASAAGLKVHKIISIQEAGAIVSQPGAQPQYESRAIAPVVAMDAAAAPTPIAGGAIEAAVTLSVTYEFRK
jgi:uncharacterized protein